MQTLPFGPYQIINRGKWISTSKLDSTKSYLHNHTKRALHFHASLFIFQYIYVYVCDSSMLHVSIVVGYPRPKREKKQGGTFNYILQNNNWIVGEKVFFLGVIIWNIYIYIYFLEIWDRPVSNSSSCPCSCMRILTWHFQSYSPTNSKTFYFSSLH